MNRNFAGIGLMMRRITTSQVNNDIVCLSPSVYSVQSGQVYVCQLQFYDPLGHELWINPIGGENIDEFYVSPEGYIEFSNPVIYNGIDDEYILTVRAEDIIDSNRYLDFTITVHVLPPEDNFARDDDGNILYYDDGTPIELEPET